MSPSELKEYIDVLTTAAQPAVTKAQQYYHMAVRGSYINGIEDLVSALFPTAILIYIWINYNKKKDQLSTEKGYADMCCPRQCLLNFTLIGTLVLGFIIMTLAYNGIDSILNAPLYGADKLARIL